MGFQDLADVVGVGRDLGMIRPEALPAALVSGAALADTAVFLLPVWQALAGRPVL